MPVEALEHYTIRCGDLEATRAFYEALGLKAAPLGDGNTRGYGILSGPMLLVQLVEADAAGAPASGGVIDRIAFRGSDAERTRERLSNLGVEFEESAAPGGRLQQIFLSDPNGVRIEINFRR
jgi:catechol 2,3-dioxygenase-like lactoylglutathione lyase family enzyme